MNPLLLSGRCIAALLFLLAAISHNASAIWINEIHYDNDGADTGEFVEIAGKSGTVLTGYSIELYTGSTGAKYGSSINLTGTLPNQENGFGTLSFPAPGLQNGAPDGLALILGGTVIEFLSYEGSFSATSGTAIGQTSTDIGVSEKSSTPIGLSLQLSGSGSAAGDFSWIGPIAASRDSKNANQSFLAIGSAQLATPDSGSTLFLLSFGLAGLASIAHRFRQAK